MPGQSQRPKTGEDLVPGWKYTFRDPKLWETARTHPSIRIEDKSREDNQRLEFLGDAVLGFLAAEYLYQHEEKASEGTMTRKRADLVRGTALAALARHWKLGDKLILSPAEERQMGREKEAALSDILEALFGAVFLDGGMPAAQHLFSQALPFLESTADGFINAKGALQEWAQANLGPGQVNYRMVSEKGPHHQKSFQVEVLVADEVVGEGSGSSKKEAEAKAAQQALIRMLHQTRQKKSRVTTGIDHQQLELDQAVSTSTYSASE